MFCTYRPDNRVGSTQDESYLVAVVRELVKKKERKKRERERKVYQSACFFGWVDSEKMKTKISSFFFLVFFLFFFLSSFF